MIRNAIQNVLDSMLVRIGVAVAGVAYLFAMLAECARGILGG